MLPLVLLVKRSSFEIDLNATSTELVYGTSFMLPGESFPNFSGDHTFQVDFMEAVNKETRALRPAPDSSHTATQGFVYLELSKVSHVTLRVDSIHRLLQLPYDGPFLDLFALQ